MFKWLTVLGRLFGRDEARQARLEAAAREALGLLVLCGQEYHPATRGLATALGRLGSGQSGKA